MLQFTQDGGVATLVMDRSKRGNALSTELVEALLAAVNRVFADGVTHTLFLRGDGPHFCTGLDLCDLDRASDGDLLHRLVRIETLLSMLWHAPIRTVAVAQGRAWGAGADLFLSCEERVALPGSTFRFPGARFGIVLGTRRLAERIGAEPARRLVIDAGELDAESAVRAGLANGGFEQPACAPSVSPLTARAIRQVTRPDHRQSDLCALVQSASEPGLRDRMQAYRDALLNAR